MIDKENRSAVMVLELMVNNHPGVMSHICGLFSRRAYNLEGIVCMPIGAGELSRMWLQVNEELKLEQVIKQVQKLPDVVSVARHAAGHPVFSGLAAFM
ncbi:acetolactate synthase small subunit [Desulfopila sp. IMCC35006]|nr:acetolactate synthase small subunit [Desulfopila sp. IMCC35006]